MGKSTREAYGEALAELGAVNDRIVVMDADLCGSTKTSTFKKAFPDRFFDFGIAEANMVCAAAGFALSGYIPFVSTFAMFGAGRAYEQIRNTVAHGELNLKVACTHAGLSVGEDGATHQSLEDVSLMRGIPGMTVLVPCDAAEARKAVLAAAELEGPVYLRLSRPNTAEVTDPDAPFVPGRAAVLREGADAAIFACGLMVGPALEAAKLLEAEGISAAVLNFHTIKPIDREAILSWNSQVKAIVTAEEHFITGGLGSAVAEVIAGHPGAAFDRVGVEDRFGQSGKPEALFESYGLTAECIAAKVKALL